jgi:glycosyltransferase involved in cell wall biosynthesis
MSSTLKEPLVSILIPAYNAEAWIADTIRSAIGQTWPHKEIIVVDDGSKDQTLSVARQFASKQVTVATQANAGAAAARNKAFALSKGGYIQWLDADDLLGPDKVEQQLRRAVSGSDRKLISGGWAYFRYRPQKARFIASPLWNDLPSLEWLLLKFGHNLHMQTATWLVSRGLTEAAGPWDTRLLGDDDGEYFCRVLLASEGVCFVPEAKVYYRRPMLGNLSYIGASSRKMEAQFLSMQLHVQYIRSLEESARVHQACVRYLQNWLPNFYPERVDLVERLQKLASELGGRLETPKLPLKYRWVEKAFGWSAAKRTQLIYNHYKSSILRLWDRMLSRFNGQKLPSRVS